VTALDKSSCKISFFLNFVYVVVIPYNILFYQRVVQEILSLFLSLSLSLSLVTESTLMQLWEILVSECPNVVSALGKKLQQYRDSSSSIGASGIQTDGALPSHDGRLVSFNVIVGTVNIASSFTRFFWGLSDCVWLACRRWKLATLPEVLGIKLCS
jgi:hypothetical protein